MTVGLWTSPPRLPASQAGTTALQWGCYKGNLEVARWLLGLGASATSANTAGADPLQLAAKAGNRELVQLILDAGGDVAHTDRFHKTALHYAAYLGRTEACDVLLSAGAEVDRVAVVRSQSPEPRPIHPVPMLLQPPDVIGIMIWLIFMGLKRQRYLFIFNM